MRSMIAAISCSCLAACASWSRPPARSAVMPPIAGPTETAPPAQVGGQERPRPGEAADTYSMLRLGAFDPRGDLADLDTGFWGELGIGQKLAGPGKLEATAGFFDVSGSGGREVYGVPLKLDGRVDVPVAIFDFYGGGGFGGMFARAKASGLGSENSFAFLWNAFAGLEVGLGRLALGAEYRYVDSFDLDAPGGVGRFQVEGHVFSLTGTLPF